MAYSDPSQGQAFAATKARSQSDSDLLNPGSSNNNGIGGIKRNTSMDDLQARGKRKNNFLYKLVRPWKWRGRRKSKLRSQGECILMSS